MSHCPITNTKLDTPYDALFEVPNITSDCRPWQKGRAVAICPELGLMQRIIAPQAKQAFSTVYHDYAMFKHSATVSDQVNFDKDGKGDGRTAKILRYIDDKLPAAPKTVLDIGCGSGAGLLALAAQYPDAEIYGYEPNDHPAERQPFLPDNVVAIWNTRPEPTQKYDLITMFHVFEHVENPLEELAFIQSILAPGGRLLIQVPYPLATPFDFVIADHIWHFSKHSMQAVLSKGDFQTHYIGNNLIAKELTVLTSPGAAVAPVADAEEMQQGHEAIQWLLRYKDFLDGLDHSKPIAIYGTAPAAAWAGHVLGECVAAYLDDDPSRVGSTFNGRPVCAPGDIAAGMQIVAPFPDYQVEWLRERNADLNILAFAA